MLNFVLAESALELVPKELWRLPAVASDSRRRGVEAGEILLDRSFHHSAMPRLKDSEKRGRPDLVHVALLSTTGTPLYQDGKVHVIVHTYPDIVIEIREKTRIPKNYIRFRGLIEKCLLQRPTEGLLRVYDAKFPELLKKLSADQVFGLSVRGSAVAASELAGMVSGHRNPCVVVGGFPHGHFSDGVSKNLAGLYRIDARPLEAHVVAARVIYEVEKGHKSVQ